MIGRHCYIIPDKIVVYEIIDVIKNNHNFKQDDLSHEVESTFVDLKSIEGGIIIEGVHIDKIELIEK